MGNSTVKFNVGGKIFEVNRSLLSKFDEEMMLRVAADLSDVPNEPIFTDRDGERFAYVLDYMRDGKVSLPFSISKGSFISDLMFYGINAVTSNIVVRGNLLLHMNSFLEDHSEQISVIEEHMKKLDAHIANLEKQKRQWALKKEFRLFAKQCLDGVMQNKDHHRQFSVDLCLFHNKSGGENSI